ncbi:Amino acid transporter, transmembrane domain, partial [Dillenia turbinata]
MAATQNNQIDVSFLKTCINGINALCGIGILSIPFALSSGGWLSLILLLIIAVSACFTALLMRRCMDSNPLIMTYTDIAHHAFGPKGRLIAAVFIFLELYLVATGFLILEGDNLHKLSPQFALKVRDFRVEGKNAFVLIAGLMILPSMWLNNLGVLSYISACGVVSSIVIVVCVFCVGATKGVGFHGKGKLIDFGGMPTALSLYTFCYGAHGVFPPIYTSMKRKNQFSKVVLISFIVCTLTYLAMAILGYLIYGQNVQSQVTLNLPANNTSAKVAIYTILAGPIAKYALVITPIASAIESKLPDKFQDSKLIGILIRLVLLVSTVICALKFPSFQSVTSLSGALLIAFVSFLFPCLCYLKIFGVHKSLGFELASIVGVIIMAILVGVIGTYSS